MHLYFCLVNPLHLAVCFFVQEAAEDVSAAGSKAGSGVSGAFDSAGRSIKGAAHNVQDKVSSAADKVSIRTCCTESPPPSLWH